MKRNRGFKLLLLAIIVLFAAYTGFWFYMRNQAERVFTESVHAAQARGEAVEFSSAEWGGFPSRLSVEIKGLKYAGGGYELQADVLHAEVLPWQPTDALLRADGNVHIASREADRLEWLEFRPAAAVARVRFSLNGHFQGADLELQQVRADGTDFNGNDFSFSADHMQVDAREAVDPEDAKGPNGAPVHASYQVAFSTEMLTISDGFAPALGPKIASIKMAAWAKKLPSMSPEGWSPNVDEFIRQFQSTGSYLEIARLDFDWGGVSGKGTGRVNLDAQWRPEGTLDFRITGLAKLIDALTKNGTLHAGAAPVPPSFPDAPGGTPIPLVIANGLVTFGPFAVGQVPALQ